MTLTQENGWYRILYQNVGILVYFVSSVNKINRVKNALMYPETIDRHSKLPYYQQLYEILLGKINLRDLQPGDRILPESELI